MKYYSYCPLCATELTSGEVGGTQRSTCASCGWIDYRNPIPVVVAVARTAEKVILVKRGVEPERGAWALPGGFMEAGEDPSTACVRELLEETSLRSRRIRMIDAVHQSSSLYGSVIVIGYEVVVENPREARPGDDAADVRWVPVDAVPGMPFESYERILDVWRGWPIRDAEA